MGGERKQCYYLAVEEKKEFVKLITVYGPVEAEIIKAKLESEGIEIFAKTEAIRGLYGIHLDGLGKVEIWVKEQDVKTARILISTPSPEGSEG